MSINWIEVARTGGAYGVRGWLRVVPIDAGDALFSAKTWRFVAMDGREKLVNVLGVKDHGEQVIALWEGVTQKEEADALRGKIYVNRDDFPVLEDDEVYACDLIGCDVVHTDGTVLGKVKAIGDNGVQDLLDVEYVNEAGKTCRFAIPMVEEVYILKVLPEEGRIDVDFDPSWRD